MLPRKYKKLTQEVGKSDHGGSITNIGRLTTETVGLIPDEPPICCDCRLRICCQVPIY